MLADEDKIAELRCPLSLLIFHDPVFASDGHTYEREEIEKIINATGISPKTREKLTKVLTPNHDKRGAVLRYLETHKELYEQDEVYLSEGLKKQLAAVIKEQNLNGVVETLKKDPRLISIPLNEKGQTCLMLSCAQGTTEILRSVIARLPDKIRLALGQPSQETLGLLSAIALNMDIAGMEIWCAALQWEETKFFPTLAFYAISLNDINLLKVALKKVDINIVESKYQRTLLHQAVIACIENMQQQKMSEVPEINLAIIKCLYSKKINGKLKDGYGLTAADLARKVNSPRVADVVEIERRRAKLIPLLDPIQATQVQLLLDVGRLTDENQQLRQQLESTRQELVMLSSSFVMAERQKAERDFMPHTCKAFSHRGNVYEITMLGEHHLIAVTKEQYKKNKLFIWDLRKPLESSCIKTIEFSENEYYLYHPVQVIFPLDGSRFIFLERDGASDGRDESKKAFAKFVVWDVVRNEEERAFEFNYSNVRIIQAVDDKKIFFHCSRSNTNNFQAALLDITTGKVSAHEDLGLKDYGRARLTSYPLSPSLIVAGDGGGYLYNCLTRSKSFLTKEAYSVFKFINPQVVAIRFEQSFRLFDIQSQQFMQSFSHPVKVVGEGAWSKKEVPRIFAICEMGPQKLATVARTDENNFQLILWDKETGIAKYQIEIPTKSRNEDKEIPLVYDAQRNLLYVGCGEVVNAIQLTPELTEKNIAVPIGGKVKFK